MTFLWPGLLVLLALVPILVGAYAWSLRRRRPVGVRYSSLSLVREAAARVVAASAATCRSPCSSRPSAALVVALGRPVAVVAVPTNQTTIILTIDVSGSMCSTDIPPSRLAAAEDAAASFVQRQGGATQIGIVAFSGFAELVQPPTNDQEAAPRRAPEPDDRAPDGDRQRDPRVDRRDRRDRPDRRAERRRGPARASSRRRSSRAPTPPTSSSCSPTASTTPGPRRSTRRSRRPTAASGSTRSASGRPTAGRSTRPARPSSSAASRAAGQPRGRAGGGGGGGGGFRRGIDEDTLRQVADLTGGTYHPAESAEPARGGLPEPPDLPDHEARGRRDRRRVRRRSPGPAWPLAFLLGRAWRPLP